MRIIKRLKRNPCQKCDCYNAEFNICFLKHIENYGDDTDYVTIFDKMFCKPHNKEKSPFYTYYDNSWHCPRCGKAVSEWGLCDECRKMYEDMRCINDEERKAWDLLIAKKNHALFQSMLCRQEDNSWKSVSE